MDGPTAAIATYVTSLDDASLSERGAHGIVRHTLDSIACALAGFDGEPCVIARRLAAAGTSDHGPSVIGLVARTTPEYATFANAAMIRYLDFNDTYHAIGGSGHPSDFIAAILAVAEPLHASGQEFLLAVHAGYEVFAAIADVFPVHDLGWDVGATTEIAAAAGVAKMLRLPAEQVGNAVALAITPNLPLGVTRTGELSHWKGCACAYAAMAGLFAARMAKEGMTGPARPFDGVRGLWHRAAPPFELIDIGKPREGQSAVERSHIKLFPADYETQAPISAMIELSRQGVVPDDVVAIEIRTYHLAWHMMGGGQGDHDEKWDPKTRETADHSLAYLVAVALADGDVSVDSFSPERIRDPELRPLMQKISIVEDPQLEKNWVADPAHEIEVSLRNGERRHVRATQARGHANNPASDDELTAKFRASSRKVLDSARSDELLDVLWRLDGLADVNELTELLRDVGRPG